jgi:hypothetical protein
LSTIPLIGTLGYFSGLIFAPIFGLVGVGIGLDGVRRLQARHAPQVSAPSPAKVLWRLSAHGLSELLALNVLVVGALLLGMIWNRNCDPWEGVGFFVVGPTISGLLGWICGLWGGVIGKTKRRQTAWGLLPFAFCLTVGVWRLYFDPVIYAFDPFWGWFAGGIYDESVAVGDRYLRFRAYNLTAGAAALLAFRALVGHREIRAPGIPAGGGDRLRLFVAVLLGLAMAWVGFHGDRFGFTATSDSITKQLSLTRETEHFVIHYAPRSKTAREIDVVAAEHEFAWRRLAAQLGHEPSAPVHSFIFKNPDHKRALFGAGKVEVSLPWKSQIYLHHLPYPHRVLHHELAHSFGAAFGDPILGISASGTRINMGLVEGFANAMAPRPTFGLDLHDQAAVLEALEKRPPLGGIMGLGFWGRASSQAYTAAGSFVLWLIETEGIDPVIEVYRNAGDFEAAFGRPLPTLEKEWVTFLRARPLKEEQVEALRERFKRRSIFRRPCAHRAAKLRKEIGRAKARGERETQIETVETLCAIEPDRPQHRIALASVHAELADYASAEKELLRALEMEDLTHAILAVVAERRGDVALLSAEFDKAGAKYSEATQYSVSEGQLRTLQVKLRATKDPAAAAEIIDYFQPFADNRGSTAATVKRLFAAVRLSQRPGWETVGNYLVARQLLNQSQAGQAIPALEAALADGGEGLGSPELVRAARIALVNAHVQTGSYDAAELLLDTLEAGDEIKTGDRLEFQWWRERISFYRSYL